MDREKRAAAAPDTSEEQRELQESFESPPPKRARADSTLTEMRESAEDLG